METKPKANCSRSFKVQQITRVRVDFLLALRRMKHSNLLRKKEASKDSIF